MKRYKDFGQRSLQSATAGKMSTEVPCSTAISDVIKQKKASKKHKKHKKSGSKMTGNHSVTTNGHGNMNIVGSQVGGSVSNQVQVNEAAESEDSSSDESS